jgi:hypothetical protein
MRSFARKPNASQQTSSAKTTLPGRTHLGQSHEVNTIGSQVMQPPHNTYPDTLEYRLDTPTNERFAFDFSRIAVHSSGVNGTLLDAAARVHHKPGPSTNASDVRIHTDEPAAASAEALDADAYTKGRDIFFGSGRYRPAAPAGRHLLMHELAHVDQQQNPGQTASSDALEREANQVATDAIAGRDARIRLSAPPARAQCQTTNWKTGDVFVDPTAATQIKTQGGLFSGNDQAHVTVSTRGKLAYDPGYTAPEDPFRWSRLKDIVDIGHLKISAISDQKQFKVQEALGGPPADRSIAEIGLLVGDPSVVGITLSIGRQSPDPGYDQIYYDKDQGVGALAHELFGHEWLALMGAPSVHPPAGSAAEKTIGTLLPAHLITDPFGNVFSGTVRDYIAKYIESLGAKATVTTTVGQRTVPKSPTQQVGADALIKAFSDLNARAPGGLTINSYSAPMAQAWRIICRNYDLMQKNSEAIQAGNTNLTYTKEVILGLCFVLFQSWNTDQQSGFRVLLADFNGNRAGFITNELSTKLEALVGAAPSPFNPGGIPVP